MKSIFSQIKILEPQKYEDIIVYPLSLKLNNVPYFITLEDALNTGKFLIKEVNVFGEVPVLKVINGLSEEVFILDGEELKGGKQNRVVNTSILVKRRSQINIPVSCTEERRWHYISDDFKDPEIIPLEVRRIKNFGVLENLVYNREYSSEQLLIWDNIERISREYDVESETSAMRDIYEKVKKDLEDKIRCFPYVEGQNGILVLRDSVFEGMDIITLNSAYKKLHYKLIKSYIFKGFDKIKRDNVVIKKDLNEILKEFSKLEPLKFKSVGLGWDLRYSSEEYIGSILTYRKNPIHINFLRREFEREM